MAIEILDAHGRSTEAHPAVGGRSEVPPPPAGATVALFDLDRTLLTGSSLVCAAAALRSSGLVAPHEMAAAVVRNLVFQRRGCGDATVERLVSALLAKAEGKAQAALLANADEIRAALRRQLRPEVVDALRRHRENGTPCAVVSASPIEIVRIAAALVDAEEAIGTVAEVDHRGRYTGRLVGAVCYGAEKIRAVERVVGRVDWASSWAYSDAASDLPLLRSVGNPVAVSPDKRLAAIADSERWTVIP